MQETQAFVKLEAVTKIYHMGEVDIHAVDGIDFEIQRVCRHCRTERRREDDGT